MIYKYLHLHLTTIICLIAVTTLNAESKKITPQLEVVIGQKNVTPTPKPGQLQMPFGVDFDSKGNMYIVELTGGRIHQRSVAGKLRTIGGDGSRSYSGDDGLLKKSTFNWMHNLTITPNDDIYIADSMNHVIRKVDAKTGIITTFAGNGKPGFKGDGGQATQAKFNLVMCISLNPKKDHIFLADLRNYRVRKINIKTGIVTTVAGNGKKGVPQDGALAIKSPLVDPRAVAVDEQENVYILERGGNALRVVTPDGKIKTVAGTGKKGKRDGTALQAQLNGSKHLCIDKRGNVIIADERNATIRLYNPHQKTLTTILGGAVTQPKAKLFQPHGVTLHDGWLYVVDSGHHRILRMKWHD